MTDNLRQLHLRELYCTVSHTDMHPSRSHDGNEMRSKSANVLKLNPKSKCFSSLYLTDLLHHAAEHALVYQLWQVIWQDYCTVGTCRSETHHKWDWHSNQNNNTTTTPLGVAILFAECKLAFSTTVKSRICWSRATSCTYQLEQDSAHFDTN